ncbi:F-box protein SKIP22 [Lactuca sativa]|uniref:F-box domain-containing protein n=1 Tax=Lactuca sativa TaxID=4236 RepID=A0A9R1VHP9_LACSA|nr:F-box protein SKIP22 [Lactuca sativa]KAJ0204957.1 hypothetical protein LSAT_V11C500268860 [Lactuca sativa]
MKLRLRSFETKETLKLEVPNPCTLHHLTQLLSQKLPSSSSRSSAIYFSLNQKDNLTTSSPEDSIQSTGITSGDLIYFTTNPNGFSTFPSVSPPPPSPPPSTSEQSQHSQTPNPNPSNPDKTLNPNPEETEDSMEIDDDGNSVSEPGKSFSVPGFLRKVFTEELGDDNGLNHKLLAIAVRAVLLESGFLEIDPVSKTLKSSNNFDIQRNWHLTSFHFTLPDLITTGNIESVKIRFQSLGKYCKVYGSLANGIVHSVLLDEDKLVPFLNVVWANCGKVVETMGDNNRVSTVEPEREVFEFWRKTKDGIAIPLLIDLCEKTGLELPPCFIQLPSELKLKILDSVSGVDVANMSCVCSELRYLASSDELWKQKYVAEFGDCKGSGSFKERFAKAMESRKRMRRVIGGRSGRSGVNLMRIRNPYGRFGPPGYFPPIRGGDHDIWMNVNVGNGVPRLRNMNVIPNCNLEF